MEGFGYSEGCGAGLIADVKIQYHVLDRVVKKVDGHMPRPVRIRVDDVHIGKSCWRRLRS